MGDEIKTAEMNGDKKRTAETEARMMYIGDVEMLVEEVKSAAREVEKIYPDFIQGQKYDEMHEALIRMSNVLRNGRYKEVGRRNPWLKTRSGEYLDDHDGDQTREDREAVVNIYNLATRSSEVIDQVCNHIEYADRVFLKTATEFFCFHRKALSAYTGDFLWEINTGFMEYNFIVQAYTVDSIYRDIPVSKVNTPEYNIELVRDDLDVRINGTSCLKNILADYCTLYAGKVNDLHVLDKATRNFAAYESELVDGGKTMIDTGETLKDKVRQLPGGAGVAGFAKAIEDVLTKISYIFLEADTIIQKYRSSEDAPYGIMHYGNRVKESADRYVSFSLTDPFKEGTRYKDFAKRLLERNKEIINVVVKNAP